MLLGWGGLAAAGVVAGAPVLGAGQASAGGTAIPAAARPGGEYDRYLAGLAAQDRFSGVVLLSHRGRTVLSRSHGMADREKGIPNHEGVAVNLSSVSQPFLAVAVLQLAQQGKVALSDPVGRYLGGLASGIAEQVTLHRLLTGTSGIDAPVPDWQRVFTSKQEVLDFQRNWVRQAWLAAPPGTGDNGHRPGGGAGLSIAAQVVEAVSGTTFWDHLRQNVFRRAGMTGSGYFTRRQWLTDRHIAQSYMLQADGTPTAAARNLDVALLDRFRGQQRQAFEHITREWPRAERVEFARLPRKYADSTARLPPARAQRALWTISRRPVRPAATWRALHSG